MSSVCPKRISYAKASYHQLEQLGHQFASTSLGEPLLTHFVNIEKLDRKVMGVQTSEIENWEINPSLKKSENTLGTLSKNGITKKRVEASRLTNKILDEELCVSGSLKEVSSVYKTVHAAVGDEFAQVKTRMKKAILGGPGGTVSTCPLIELATNLFGVKHSTDHRNRAAVLRTLAKTFTAEEASPHKFWESMTNKLTEMEALAGENLEREIEDAAREDEEEYFVPGNNE
ncbi:hypothetical protein DFS34DRAFT_691351 [Phlyctochytrium arcticum]|nr:hypothetical protein DFS34DRAFT_691351 [Phlyctochytrium arcticum]